MKKRLLVAALWFYAAWTLGSMIAWTMGLSVPLGPALAILAVALVVRVPRLAIEKRAIA